MADITELTAVAHDAYVTMAAAVDDEAIKRRRADKATQAREDAKAAYQLALQDLNAAVKAAVEVLP